MSSYRTHIADLLGATSEQTEVLARITESGGSRFCAADLGSQSRESEDVACGGEHDHCIKKRVHESRYSGCGGHNPIYQLPRGRSESSGRRGGSSAGAVYALGVNFALRDMSAVCALLFVCLLSPMSDFVWSEHTRCPDFVPRISQQTHVKSRGTHDIDMVSHHMPTVASLVPWRAIAERQDLC